MRAYRARPTCHAPVRNSAGHPTRKRRLQWEVGAMQRLRVRRNRLLRACLPQPQVQSGPTYGSGCRA